MIVRPHRANSPIHPDLVPEDADLAREHAVPSVVLGLAAREGDLSFPEFVAFLQSALRVEDAIRRAQWFLLGLGKLGEMGGAREVAEQLVAAYADDSLIQISGRGYAPVGEFSENVIAKLGTP